jgi:hypothetical protein
MVSSMAFVYIVRCNFSDPGKEQAWNEWYSGPKIAQMLAKPLFQTCQRFRLASGDGRTYFTLWTIQSPEVFETPEYKSDWGFFEWAPYVTDWSRDVFDGRFAPEAAFAVSLKGSLHVVSFDGMSKDDACAARAVLAKSNPEMLWLPVIGLDRSCPMIGLQPLFELASPPKSKHGRDKQTEEAIYRPMSDVFAAEGSKDRHRPSRYYRDSRGM